MIKLRTLEKSGYGNGTLRLGPDGKTSDVDRAEEWPWVLSGDCLDYSTRRTAWPSGHLCVLASVLVINIAAACGDSLDVKNVNNPDTERALANPRDAEAVIGSSFNTIHSAHYGALDALWPQLLVMGLEHFTMLGNANMGARAAIQRTSITNHRGRENAAAQFRDFQLLQRAARTAANGLIRANQPGFSLGSQSREFRGRAFAHLVIGIANGDAGLAYDSAAIVNERVASADIPPLSPGVEVTAAGIASLDSAIATAQSAITMGAAFTTEATWIRGQVLTAQDLIRLARSYRARFRAQVHRDPVSRRNRTDWSAVITDAESGITVDFTIDRTPVGWPIQTLAFVPRPAAALFFYGMADTSRAYDQWLSVPFAQRGALNFLIKTPDLRFPQGETRADHIQSSNGGELASTPLTFPCADGSGSCSRYIHHGAGRETPFDNPYLHARTNAVANGGNVGRWAMMTRAEMDLLAAEGYVRIGNVAAAVALVNRYRTRNGLPAIPTTATEESIVPGGSACVPRVPAPPEFTTTRCGTVFDALKYEKRLETAIHGWGMWYFDGRGWGDLPEGTPLHFPVPQQELDTRSMPLYELGGVGGKDAAPRGNYGF